MTRVFLPLLSFQIPVYIQRRTEGEDVLGIKVSQIYTDHQNINPRIHREIIEKQGCDS